MWCGPLDDNCIPLFFTMTKEELRVCWEDHFLLLDLNPHPIDAMFVNSFFPSHMIPSEDCLLHSSWAMPHNDGCLGQCTGGPDVFRITLPRNKYNSLNNIKNINNEKKMAWKSENEEEEETKEGTKIP